MNQNKTLFSTILVTGCGGDIALGLGKILKQCQIADRIIGCDIHDDHAGSAVFNDCFKVKRADDPDYLGEITFLVKEQSVDLVIPVSEPELRALLRLNTLDSIADVPVIIANKKSLELGFDKLATAEFLKKLDCLSPWTRLVCDGAPNELPCIVKSRFGSGSKDVRVVNSEILIDFYSQNNSDFIWQELLLPDDQEYTCGLYRTLQGETRSIIMNRKLTGGLTGQGVVVESPEIKDLLCRLAESIDLKSSINVQLRLTAKGPVVFEINPRFSSTIVFRHQMGFQDVLWSVQECAGLTLGNYNHPKPGTRFYRLSQEYFIPASDQT
jgi:carbamoyl-phosphate synthase large subunit